MVHVNVCAATAASLSLLFSTVSAQGLYTKSSPVLQVDGKSYESLIAQSNHTSIVEFYAPWCGHCKNLQPAYEKAAKALAGLAKVAAVNCDEESNKPFCGGMGVQGFPTLKIVRPGKKPGRPNVEDYQGARTAKGIVDAVKDKIPNHVKRLTDTTYAEWLEDGSAKAVLFSDKGTTSALLKAVAIDYLGSIAVAQIRDKEKAASEQYGVSSYPTLLLFPGAGKGPIPYDGEFKKEAISKFLSQVASPNPDPAPKKAKSGKSSTKSGKQASKDSSSFSAASKSHASADSSASKATQTSETLEEGSNPTESPNPNVVESDTQKPIQVPQIAPITSLDTPTELQQACLTSKSGTCILALLPPGASTGPETLSTDSASATALSALAAIRGKHSHRGGKLFPFYAVPSSNTAAEHLLTSLGLSVGESDVHVLAVNGKKAWTKRFAGPSASHNALEDWIDGIRMGDGAKEKLPAGLIVEPAEKSKAAPAEEPRVQVEEIEELTDEEVERLLAHAKQQGKPAPAHEEL